MKKEMAEFRERFHIGNERKENTMVTSHCLPGGLREQRAA